MARQLAPRVAHLALVARRVDRLDALALELCAARPSLKVSVLPCDLSDPDAVRGLGDRLRQALGEVDVLVNNAGAGHAGYFDEVDWEQTERLFTLNALAPARLIRDLLPGMLARGRGGILNVSSGFGLATLPTFGPYIATKHFLSGLTETLRAEAAGSGVVITQSCPGPVDTDFVTALEGSLVIKPPKMAFISAARCARESLDAFERGKALVVPGRRMRLAMWLIRSTPDFLVRFIHDRLARRKSRPGLG